MGVRGAVPSATRARKFSDSGEVGTFTIMSVIAQDVAVFSLFTSTSYWSDLGMSVSECAVAGSHRNMAHAATAFLTRPIIGIRCAGQALLDARRLRLYLKQDTSKKGARPAPTPLGTVTGVLGFVSDRQPACPRAPTNKEPDLIAIRSGSSLVGST
jgi:hypothetical protein